MEGEDRTRPTQRFHTDVNVRELRPGDRVKLEGDVIVEIIENPEDGLWIRGKYVSVPGNRAIEGGEDQIFATDIVERV